jgi:hypothetical protein
VRCKRDAVLRLLQGEPLDALGLESGVELYRLEAWRNKALQGMKMLGKNVTAIRSIRNSKSPGSISVY